MAKWWCIEYYVLLIERRFHRNWPEKHTATMHCTHNCLVFGIAHQIVDIMGMSTTYVHDDDGALSLSLAWKSRTSAWYLTVLRLYAVAQKPRLQQIIIICSLCVVTLRSSTNTQHIRTRTHAHTLTFTVRWFTDRRGCYDKHKRLDRWIVWLSNMWARAITKQLLSIATEPMAKKDVWTRSFISRYRLDSFR